RRRVVHLPNGFEPEAAPSASAPAASGGRERFDLLFTGTLAQMPDAEVLLEALHDWFARHPEARRRVRARFAGPYETGYEDRAIALGLKGIVEFLGPRPHAESLVLQRGAGVLLLWKPRNYPAMVPGKLYEYLDSGRPVLAVLPPGDEAGALVERAGGEVVAPGDRAALAARLERRYSAWKAGEAGGEWGGGGSGHAIRARVPRARLGARAGPALAAAALHHRRHLHPPPVRAAARGGPRPGVQRRRARLRLHEPAVGSTPRRRDDDRHPGAGAGARPRTRSGSRLGAPLLPARAPHARHSRVLRARD